MKSDVVVPSRSPVHVWLPTVSSSPAACGCRNAFMNIRPERALELPASAVCPDCRRILGELYAEADRTAAAK